MDIVQAILLGVLQGLTEWLPISSQGQVSAVALALFSIPPEQALNDAIFLHIGTMIAAAAYFRRELSSILRPENRQLLYFIATALIGSAITAVPAFLFLRMVSQSGFALLILIGIGLIFTGAIQLRKKISQPKENIGSGFLTGLAQGLAVIPGISRSGVTTAALLFEDFDPEQAFRLSFLLSVPSVFLAEILFIGVKGAEFHPLILVSIAIAAIVGYVTIDVLITVARKINFAKFCIAFGVIYIALAFI